MKIKPFLKLAAGGILCGTVYVIILALSILLCFSLFVLPERFGFSAFLYEQSREQLMRDSWTGIIMASALILGFILQLVLPFLAAGWFYRASDRLAARCFGISPDHDRNA